MSAILGSTVQYSRRDIRFENLHTIGRKQRKERQFRNERADPAADPAAAVVVVEGCTEYHTDEKHELTTCVVQESIRSCFKNFENAIGNWKYLIGSFRL